MLVSVIFEISPNAYLFSILDQAERTLIVCLLHRSYLILGYFE